MDSVGGGGAITAQFGSSGEAEQALSRLRASGIIESNVSVVVQDAEIAGGIGTSVGSNVAAAAAIGALFGAIVGAFISWAMTIGSAALPGAGPYSGVSSPAAAVNGAVLGGIIGGLLGALIGFAVPVRAKGDIEELNQSKPVTVTVRTPLYYDPSRVEALLRESGGQAVYSEGAADEDTAAVTLTRGARAAGTPQAKAEGDLDNVQQLPGEGIQPGDAGEEPEIDPAYSAIPGYSGEFTDASPLPGVGTPADLESWGDADMQVPGGTVADYNPAAATVEDDTVQAARRDVDESAGEPNWYEALLSLPATPTPQGDIAGSGRTENEETFADLRAMEAAHRRENEALDENPEGTNANNVTGTQGAINPDTGAFGTAGTPITTGYGVSGSTIGVGTEAEELATQTDDFRGETPDSSSYEHGGRGSTDEAKLRKDERALPVTEKYAGQTQDAAPAQVDKDTQDIYEQEPSYGGQAGSIEDATASTYANAPVEEAQASAGTNIPGTADIRGLGDNTDDPNDPNGTKAMGSTGR